MNAADDPRRPDPGAGAMLADVLAGVSRLVQGEVALARAEAEEKLASAGRGAVQAGVAAILGITALNLLAGCAVAVLAGLGMSPTWAAAAVGGVLLLAALGFAQHAAGLLRAAGTLPQRSAASLRRDVETLQTMVKSDATT